VTDLVVVEFCGEPFAFTREEIGQARDRARSVLGSRALPAAVAAPAAPALVDAEELGRLTSTPASWWLAAARESDCPSSWVGKCRRFNVQQCLRWLEQAQERDGTGRARRCAAVPRART